MCEADRRAGPTPCCRAAGRPGPRHAPSSAVRVAECSVRSGASPGHTLRHTPHCDSPVRPLQPHDGREQDMSMRTKLALLAALVGAASLTVAAQAGQQQYSAWEPAQKIDEIDGNNSELNTPSQDGCPIQSPDGRSLYMASNRPGGKGLLDIWVAHRPNRHAPWGAPENLGEPVNSAADDFCPTPVKHGGLFFVSREALPGSCGLGDIYFTRYSRKHGWSEPQNLGCAPDGPNGELDEQGPSYVEAGPKASLYFSRSSATVPGDIFVSKGYAGWGFGPATAVTGVERSPGERHPAERAEGRARGRLLLEPRGHARRPGHLGRDAAKRPPPVVAPGQSGRGGEHGGCRVASFALAKRAAAPLRACARPGGHRRHLRDDADDDRPQAPLRHPGLRKAARARRRAGPSRP